MMVTLGDLAQRGDTLKNPAITSPDYADDFVQSLKVARDTKLLGPQRANSDPQDVHRS